MALSEPRAISACATCSFRLMANRWQRVTQRCDFENAAMIWSDDERKLTATLKHEFGVASLAFTTMEAAGHRRYGCAGTRLGYCHAELLQAIEVENATPDLIDLVARWKAARHQ